MDTNHYTNMLSPPSVDGLAGSQRAAHNQAVTTRRASAAPISRRRPPRKRAGARLGQFWRRLVRIPHEVSERDIASIRAKPEVPDRIAIALAEVARTFTSSLVAVQQLPTAREIATALRNIEAWAGAADPAVEPPWTRLIIVPAPCILETDPVRAALTLVGNEARAVDRDPSRDNFSQIADAAARIASELEEIAGKRGASGPPGAARHARAAEMVADVAFEFHKAGIATPLRHPDEWRTDWEDRPVFVAVKAVLSTSEGHLEALKEMEPATARNALLALRAARDAPHTLVQVVRTANRRRKAAG